MTILGRIFVHDVRLLFSLRRTGVFFPLTIAAVLVALWPYSGSPYVPIVAALFAGLESSYANILFRTHREFEAFAVTPVPWEVIILGKNLATLLVTFVVFGLMSMVLWYILPDRPTGAETREVALWIGSLVFPLLYIGNQSAVRKPRRRTGWSLADAAEACVFLAMAALLSIPYILLSIVAGEPLLVLLYIGAAAGIWFRFSIPRTAEDIRSATNSLSLTR